MGNSKKKWKEEKFIAIYTHSEVHKSHRAKEKESSRNVFYGGPEAAQIFLHCDP